MSADRRFAAGEEGQSVFEAAVTVSLMLLVLLPVAFFISSTSGNIENQQLASIASKIVSSQLSSARATGAPTSSNPLVPVTAWPTSVTTTSTVQGVTFSVYQVGGWCAESSGSGSAWTTTTLPSSGAAQTSYFVAVKVSWPIKASSKVANSVISSTAVPGITGSPTSGSVASCPLALVPS